MADTDRAVELTARELGVIQGLAANNNAAVVGIREQTLAQGDAWYGPMGRSEGRHAYVVTIRKQSESAEPSFESPEIVQLLVISGPDIDGPVDVVALSPVMRMEVPA